MRRGVCFFLPFWLSVSLAHASGVSEYFSYRKGLSWLQSEQPERALNEFLKSLESDPLNPQTHMALGSALLAMQKPDQAAKAFRSAHKLARTPEDKFQAAFNAGYAYGEAKDIDRALEMYQAALEVHPESVEVKTNIELLLQGQQGDQSQQGDQGEQSNKSDNNQNGQGKDQNDKSDQNQDQQKDPQQDKAPEQKKPQKFESQALTPNDVKNILEELKSQEQGIRWREYEQEPKERPPGKDW